MMKTPFHLMAKPASFHCNLACKYCFYLEKGETILRQAKPSYSMSDPVLSAYIRRYIAGTAGDEVAFTWQGGEPMLAGLNFYHRVVALQQQFANGKRITNNLQTNGVLINDRWAEFLAQHRFLVGVSVDGPQHIYDAGRRNHAGGSVFSKVVDGLKTLQRHDIAFNLLATVNAWSAKYPLEIYRFLTRELGGRFIQFIPVVEPSMARTASARRFGETIALENEDVATCASVRAKAWGNFNITIFNEWVRHDVGRIFVQLFDNTLAAWSGETPGLCVMRANCGASLVIEQNGDIYCCDHFVEPQHLLGNILRDAPEKLASSKQQRRFASAKTPTSAACQRCPYRFACQGGCPKHRLLRDGNHAQNFLCEGYYAFFDHVRPYMAWMSAQLERKQPPAAIMESAAFIAAQLKASQR